MTEPEILEMGDEPVEPVESSPLSTFERFLLSATIWPTVLFMGWFICAFFWDADEWFDSVAGVAVFMVCISAGKRLRRFLVRGRLRAGIFIGAFGAWPGLTIGVVAAAVGLTLAVGLSLDDDARREIGEILASAQIESQEAELTEEASSAPSAPGSFQVVRSTSEHRAFTSCIEEIYRARTPRSMFEEAVHQLSPSYSPAFAEDAAQEVVISVCIAESKKKRRNLREYFFKSVYNKRSDRRKKNAKWKYCQFDDTRVSPYEDDYESRETLRIVHKNLCNMDDRKAYIVRARLKNVSDERIARDLGITRAYVRKLHSLAVAELRERTPYPSPK